MYEECANKNFSWHPQPRPYLDIMQPQRNQNDETLLYKLHPLYNIIILARHYCQNQLWEVACCVHFIQNDFLTVQTTNERMQRVFKELSDSSQCSLILHLSIICLLNLVKCLEVAKRDSLLPLLTQLPSALVHEFHYSKYSHFHSN